MGEGSPDATRKQIRLTPNNLEGYLALSMVRNNCFKWVNLCLSEQEDVTQALPQLQSFAEKHCMRVKLLGIDWQLNVEKAESEKFFDVPFLF